MSAAVEQPCSVCGQPATSRCQRCAGASIGTSYCSREHQRLVWFMHKRICGRRPVSLPPLSPDEAKEVKEKLAVPLVPGMHATSIEGVLQRRYPLCSAQIRVLVESVTEGSPAPSKPNLLFVSTCTIRNCLAAHYDPDNDDEVVPPLCSVAQHFMGINDVLIKHRMNPADCFGEAWDEELFNHVKYTLAALVAWGQQKPGDEALLADVRKEVQQQCWRLRMSLLDSGGLYDSETQRFR
ncbi:hypothetical protein JCM10213_005713 [Rhodosporidiobolus nylandii]